MEIKTKYNIGDTIYFLQWGELLSSKVINIRVSQSVHQPIKIEYWVEEGSSQLDEIECFTKDQAISKAGELIDKYREELYKKLSINNKT